MIGPDDYHHEMGKPVRISDDEVERLLQGRPGGAPEPSELEGFLQAVRKSLVEPPDAATAARHLAAIAEAARAPAAAVKLQRSHPGGAVIAPARRGALRRSISIATRVAAAGVAAVLSTVGLAYAGVDLPGTAAERAVERITGLDLPNQAPENAEKTTERTTRAGTGKSRSDDVQDVIEGSDAKGCEFGQEVSEAASSNRNGDDPGNDPCAKARGKGASSNRRNDAGNDKRKGARGTRGRGKPDDRGKDKSAIGPGREKKESRSQAGEGDGNQGRGHDDAERGRGEERSGAARDKPKSPSGNPERTTPKSDDAGDASIHGTEDVEPSATG